MHSTLTHSQVKRSVVQVLTNEGAFDPEACPLSGDCIIAEVLTVRAAWGCEAPIYVALQNQDGSELTDFAAELRLMDWYEEHHDRERFCSFDLIKPGQSRI